MFTGLIHHCGRIEKIEPLATGIRLMIETQFEDLELGESIAVDGACLTVTELKPKRFTVELSTETLDLTIAQKYIPQQLVNLERALSLSDRLGGHFVTGHVDQTAEIGNITKHDEFYEYVIQGLKSENQNLLVTKGSITVNGVSLTVNKITNQGCHLMLIPHTLAQTNLKQLKVEDKVNIEFDLLAKLIAQQIRGYTHVNSI